MLLQNRFLYGELFWLGFYLVFDALANRTFLNLGLWRRCYRLVFKSYETRGVVLNVWQTGKFSSKKYKLPRILATRFMLQALPLSKKDAALPWQVSFQQAATVDSAAIQALYCDVLFFLYFIAFFILYLIFKIVQQNRGELSPRVWAPGHNQEFSHNNALEWVWTALPTLILAVLAFPSFSLLYLLGGGVAAPEVTLKVFGGQWF
jgi:hypothetical protein